MPFGSRVREFVVELDPTALVQARFSVEEVVTALDEASAAPAAAFHVDRGQEYLVRGLGRFIDVAIRNVTLALRDGANVFRRLRQEHRKPEGERRSAVDVVFRASSEARGAIVLATLVIALVFLPLLVLPGLPFHATLQMTEDCRSSPSPSGRCLGFAVGWRDATSPERIGSLREPRGRASVKWADYQQDVEGREYVLSYYRDGRGREVDFVVSEDRKPVLAVEAKWAEERVDRGLGYFKSRFPRQARHSFMRKPSVSPVFGAETVVNC